MKKIDAVWICVIKDDEKDEEYPVLHLNDMYYRYLTAKEDRLAFIEKAAQRLANNQNIELHILKFTNSELVETIKPEIDDGNH